MTNQENKTYFKDKEEFQKYIFQNKPSELWLDEFMENEPYVLLKYDKDNFRGCYNHQSLLSGNQSDFKWLYKENIYVKIMTNQEKDLKNAREYLNNEQYKDCQLMEQGRVVLGREELPELLAKHVQWLEQKGVIQFTSNRHLVDENNGLVKCKHCDRLNCKYNDSCIECGESDYK